MVHAHRTRAFTLIEVLVVVAIIAMLVAILLPSLARARAEARFVVCQTNVRHLMMAFLTYSVDNQGRLPGIRGDQFADWLGGDNGPFAERVYGRNGDRGKQPEWGTIFKKHMGGMTEAYTCPEDKTYRQRVAKGESFHSYTANLMVAGAKTEMLGGAHYPLPLTSASPQYDRPDHRTRMGTFERVPVIIEEDVEFYLETVDDSGWCNDDSFTSRHTREPGGYGYASVGFSDGHAGRFRAPLRTAKTYSNDDKLAAVNLCLRTAGGKWVSGYSWGERGGMYRYMDAPTEASALGIKH